MKDSLNCFMSFLLPIKCFEHLNEKKQKKKRKNQILQSIAVPLKHREKKIKTVITEAQL